MKGVTLIELIIVLLIIVILAGIGYTGFSSWALKNKVEKDTRAIYSELTHIRMVAFTEKRVCGVYWESEPFNTLHIRCDNDSDSDIKTGYEELGLVKLQTDFVIPSGLIKTRQTIRFATEGYAMESGTVKSNENANPEYNCVVVSLNRIALGHWNGTDCEIR